MKVVCGINILDIWDQGLVQCYTLHQLNFKVKITVHERSIIFLICMFYYMHRTKPKIQMTIEKAPFFWGGIFFLKLKC